MFASPVDVNLPDIQREINGRTEPQRSPFVPLSKSSPLKSGLSPFFLRIVDRLGCGKPAAIPGGAQPKMFYVNELRPMRNCGKHVGKGAVAERI